MSDSIQMLGRILDATALRQKVLANNLANADTPGYVRQDVRFSEALANALDSDIQGVEKATSEIVLDTDSPARPDGNNVSLQRELGEMTENSLLYQFAAKTVDRKFEELRKAIRGR